VEVLGAPTGRAPASNRAARVPTAKRSVRPSPSPGAASSASGKGKSRGHPSAAALNAWPGPLVYEPRLEENDESHITDISVSRWLQPTPLSVPMTGDSLSAASVPAISPEKRSWGGRAMGVSTEADENYGDWGESEGEVECPEGVNE